jgi:hypothetical protein
MRFSIGRRRCVLRVREADGVEWVKRGRLWWDSWLLKEELAIAEKEL